MPRVSLFIADDVGLGKTIEAGLILRELLLRQKVHRVVVIAPPSVVLQLKGEMESRFGLGFALMDRQYVAEMRRQGAGASTPGPPTPASASARRWCAMRPMRVRCATGSARRVNKRC
jgi:SNF2 family DNA or RNA helicase